MHVSDDDTCPRVTHHLGQPVRTAVDGRRINNTVLSLNDVSSISCSDPTRRRTPPLRPVPPAIMVSGGVSVTPREEDISKMLKCNTHLGTKNCDVLMEPYVFKRRSDGMLSGRRLRVSRFALRDPQFVFSPCSCLVAIARRASHQYLHHVREDHARCAHHRRH